MNEKLVEKASVGVVKTLTEIGMTFISARECAEAIAKMGDAPRHDEVYDLLVPTGDQEGIPDLDERLKLSFYLPRIWVAMTSTSAKEMFTRLRDDLKMDTSSAIHWMLRHDYTSPKMMNALLRK